MVTTTGDDLVSTLSGLFKQQYGHEISKLVSNFNFKSIFASLPILVYEGEKYFVTKDEENNVEFISEKTDNEGYHTNIGLHSVSYPKLIEAWNYKEKTIIDVMSDD